MNDSHLAKKLFWIVAIKLMVLFVLWWAFVRHPGVEVDPSMMMAPAIQQPTQGEARHDQ